MGNTSDAALKCGMGLYASICIDLRMLLFPSSYMQLKQDNFKHMSANICNPFQLGLTFKVDNKTKFYSYFICIHKSQTSIFCKSKNLVFFISDQGFNLVSTPEKWFWNCHSASETPDNLLLTRLYLVKVCFCWYLVNSISVMKLLLFNSGLIYKCSGVGDCLIRLWI